VRSRFLVLALVAGFAAACTPKPPPAPAAPLDPASDLERQTKAAIEEVTAYLRKPLSLSADQEEKTRQAARNLLERNARLVEEARTASRRILEPLRQSHQRFDAEILAILTAEQAPKYLLLKRRMQEQTALGRSPFAPSPHFPRPVPTPPRS
jgi:hypothetical protein